MVAFFKYLAEKTRIGEPGRPILQRDMIFAIEEPETYLHPSAQRELIESFRALIANGYQILITSHSPVFAAEAEQQGLLLIVRDRRLAVLIQRPELTPERVIDELGIQPRDQLFGYDACVFVEGKGDQVFLEIVAEKLKTAGLIAATFRERNIGLVVAGGDNLRFYIEGQTIKKLNRKFAVLKDSDRKMRGGSLSKRIVEWKSSCEAMGGRFLILNKRQIENYFHPDAIRRVTQKTVIVEDYNDVKKLISTDYDWERHLKPIVEQMTLEEILDRDRESDGTSERHELVEKISQLLQLSGP